MSGDDIARLVHDAIARAQESGALPPFTVPLIPVAHPKQEGHGDWATPVCLQLAGVAHLPPLRIAEIVVQHLAQAECVGKVEVAKPGFINITLSEVWLAQQVQIILDAGLGYGNVNLGQGKKVQVEFISANPTGPLHIGSARNAAIGDALASVLAAAGYQVQREYYVNDAGTQMEIFGATLYARYAQALGHDEAVPEGGYQGAYMIDMGKRAAEENGSRFLELERGQAVRAMTDLGLAYMVESIKADSELMGIRYDKWFSERSLYRDGVFDRVMAILRSGGHVMERDGAVWFKATELGDAKDEVVVRSNGAPGYFASDIAYHYDKFVLRKFDWVIDIWGADHQGHVPRMHAMMRALGLDPERLSIILYQLVTLKRGGEVVRLSKRTGEIITLREVLEEVGADAVRYFLVSRSADSQMDFDLELAKEQSSENPVYYIQYAHARICSIARLAAERGPLESGGDLRLLTHPMELELIRRMLNFPEAVWTAAHDLSPHHLAHYALDLASQFHLFYRDCRVLSSEPGEQEISKARLKLALAARTVLARSLNLMGMTAPEQM
jgi:arginyl-tRNA synthetase